MMLEPGKDNLVLETAVSTCRSSQGCSTEAHILMFGCYFCKESLKSLSPLLPPLLFKAIIIDAPACLSV